MPDLVVPGLVPDLVPDYTTSPLQVEKKEKEKEKEKKKEKIRREKAMKQNTKVIVRFQSARPSHGTESVLLMCVCSNFKQACCAGCRRRPFPMQLHQ